MDTLFGQDVIKSIGFNEGEILRNIQELHCPHGFELDPCYSIGSFYERFGIKQPKMKFDINPQAKGVSQADACNLPVQSESVKSIMFDPPFLASCGPSHEGEANEGSNIIVSRFSAFRTMEDLWEWYSKCLVEFYRVLVPKGVLVFKNQDTISSAKQYFSHVHIINEAQKVGFYAKDLFLLLVKNRIIGGNHQIQYHARKFHSYYWVFVKQSKVK